MNRPDSPAGRRPGCRLIALYILFPPLWLARHVAPAAWRTANRIFSPRHTTVPPHRRLDRVQTARTISGTVVVVGIYLYTDRDTGLDAFGQDLTTKVVTTIIIGFGAIVLGLVGLIIITRSGFRRAVVSRLRHPALAVVGTVGLGGSIAVVGETDFPRLSDASGLFTALLLLLAVMAVGIFTVTFWLRGMFLIGKNLFNTADVHPMLPCLITPVPAWIMTGMELAQPSIIPSTMHRVVALSGATIVTVLSIVEWRYLREQGLSIRTGPYPGGR